MFLASTPAGGAPMSGDRLQPFSTDAETALLVAAGQQAVLTGRTVTGLAAARQTPATRMREPLSVPAGAAMSAVSGVASNNEVQS